MSAKICSVKRKCVLCGKEFIAKSSRRKRCYDDHYRPCAVCGKPIIVKDKSSPLTCSESCRRIQIGKTSSEVQSKLRYKRVCSICGKIFYSASPRSSVCYLPHQFTCECCGKVFYPTREEAMYNKKTCSNDCRYKLSNYTFMQNVDEHMSKRDVTMMLRYGDTSPSRIPELLEKRRNTCLEKYGYTSFCSTQQFLDKTRETNRKRYGADWYQQTNEFKEKSKRTLLDKYGVDNYFKSRDFMLTSVSHPEFLSNLFEFKQDPEKFIATHFNYQPSLQELSEILGIVDSSVGYILQNMEKQYLVRHTYSRMEEEVYKFINQYIPSTLIVRNTKREITPYEIDIYIPSCNFGIECNPTSTHNSTMYAFNSRPHGSTYHKIKTDLAESKGIFLLHLFGHHWNNKKEICKFIILQHLNLTTIYLYEDVDISYLSESQSNSFLDTYHLEGSCNSDVQLGAYYNNELLAVICFSLLNKDEWIISRLCSSYKVSSHEVLKFIFDKFVDDYDPRVVTVVSDRSHDDNKLYTDLGFQLVETTEPRCIWVNMKDDEFYNDVKDIDFSLLSIEDNSANTDQILIDNGYVQVFDSGKSIWNWER